VTRKHRKNEDDTRCGRRDFGSGLGRSGYDQLRRKQPLPFQRTMLLVLRILRCWRILSGRMLPQGLVQHGLLHARTCLQVFRLRLHQHEWLY
jgi:hypothetical protein